MNFYKDVLKKYPGQKLMIVTLAAIKGSAPQEVGAKMLVGDQGLLSGTVGGGKIEAHCIKYSQQILLNEKQPVATLQTWNLQTDIGMSCGGSVDILFEPIGVNSKWTLAIFGAGHISQEICRILSSWQDIQVLVFDQRPEWLERLPNVDHFEKHHGEDLSDYVQALPKNTYLISMTQGHATDFPILKSACLRADSLAFIGVIGSKLKGQKIRKELLEVGLSVEAVSRVQCPLGLQIGKDTPQEIAISVISQLLQLR